MNLEYNTNYPSIDDIRLKAKKRIPKFAFEYLDGGCNEDINLKNNTLDIRNIQLMPDYLSTHNGVSLKTKIFNKIYDAPFGIAPVGLQGLIWPQAAEILAKAAYDHNIPFILSTVSTASIEKIANITEGNAWFQLYHPAKEEIRNDIIKRVQNANLPVLVLLSDVPTFGYRPRDIRNGLAMPPKMSIKNFLQIAQKPNWAIQTLLKGQPNFETLKPYMPKKLNLSQLGQFMNQMFSGRLDEEKIKPIRDLWKGKLVIKGIVNENDIKRAIKLGVDGIIVSNHGGRQLDAGESSIKSLERIVDKYQNLITIILDSGVRTGPDIARCLAQKAQFTFLGRTFMYSVAALGNKGGQHAIATLKIQLKQIMEQIGCSNINNLPNYKI